MIILKYQLLGKNIDRKKWRLADFLSTKGFSPNHWYSNWKEIEENIWLVFTNPSRSDPKSPSMQVELLLRDSPPNVGGSTFEPTDKEQLKRVIEKQIRPMVLQLLEESKIPYTVIGGGVDSG